ncbi:MAG: hypothetical protein LBU26_06665 [Synergistaceae bacterium]|jgi:hypothetical protein|nr:hypothetical protein [Synergistaceae bacterium]
MNANSAANATKYLAFITHCDSAQDAREARRLERRLENFRVPVNEVSKLRAADRETEPVPEHLQIARRESPPEEKPVDAARFLIVVCSPRAAESAAVNGDVSDFIAAGREECIIPYIIEGNPVGDGGEKCYPASLSAAILGVTVSAGTREEALIRVMARLLGVKFSLLYQRHLREKRRFAVRALCAAAAVFAILSVLCGVAVINEADASKRLKEADALAMFLASEFSDDRLPPETLAAIKEATRKHFGGE